MSESISQGIPFLELDSERKIRLYKCNDISFTSLKEDGFECNESNKKPDQIIAMGEKKKIVLIAIEDKDSKKQMQEAVQQIEDNYIHSLPQTHIFIARAGNEVKVLYRLTNKMLVEVQTLRRNKDVICFGPKMITGENKEAIENLKLLVQRVREEDFPINSTRTYEIDPPFKFNNPLIQHPNLIKRLWQKIFVCTGEEAHSCLNTFVELLIYKGVSDAGLLPQEYTIGRLKGKQNERSLNTYMKVIRSMIDSELFPSFPNQPGVVNLSKFAFTGQETTFKSVLKDLDELGNLAQKQIDPDFKRKVLETFLGSSNKEGKIKNGQHLTPRNIVQAIWRMANPQKDDVIIDPACGVGGFVLEGLNYPYEFDYKNYRGIGIDKSETMITLAKANMVLHLLDKIAENPEELPQINQKINEAFHYTDHDGTGTLGELSKIPDKKDELTVNYAGADYVLANVPFFSNGVKEIDKSLKKLGNFDKFYKDCGLGIQSRFLKYILSQIQEGEPGMAFVIVPYGVLKNKSDNTRTMIKNMSDVLAIISLPKGTFQNNNWKTAILVFQKKTEISQHSKVMLYNVKNIGVTLDQFRAPKVEDDLNGMVEAWKRRLSGESEDPNCKYISRKIFNAAEKWSTLFDDFDDEIDDTVSFSKCIHNLTCLSKEIQTLLDNTNEKVGELFSFDEFEEYELSDEENFEVFSSPDKYTINYAKRNLGDYPLYSSQVTGPVEYMTASRPPLLADNELGEEDKIISWNIKGDAAQDVRLHTLPFYVTENRGLIKIKNPNITYEYLVLYLKENLAIMGDFNRDNEAHVGKVRNLYVKLPIDEEGNIDIDKQKEIVDGYMTIQTLRQNVSQKIEKMKELLENINVTK